MHTATLITFTIYLIALMLLGWLAYRQTHNLADYILGNRKLGSVVAALSAGAADMSGWLMLGLPGALYASGLNQIWIAIGLTIGAYLNWKWIAQRLRVQTEQTNNALTLPDFFHYRFQDNTRILRILSATIILLFFTFYTSSGLVSGARVFENSFGLDYTTALWVGTIVILAYTFIGGFFAVCWTDVLQGLLMILALIIVPVMTLYQLGGWDLTTQQIATINPELLNPFHDTSGLKIISLMAWGLGYFGQPHILARFMAIESASQIPQARRIGLTWMIICLLGAMATGFIGIAYFAKQPLPDPEKVFLVLSQTLFNPWLTGILLAAILSAIMSTISAQLLVSSTTVTEDFYKGLFRKNASSSELMWVGRFSVILIGLIALWIATNPQSSILNLVAYAWAGLGSAFGPLLIFSLFWPRITRHGAIAGLIVGAVTVVIWERLTHAGLIPFKLYEMVPAFIFSSLAIYGVSLLGKTPTTQHKFEE